MLLQSVRFIVSETIYFPQKSTFRQSAQIHSDWVNDIVLTNYNQTGTFFLEFGAHIMP